MSFTLLSVVSTPMQMMVYDIDYHPLSKVGYVKCHKEDKKKEYVIFSDPKDFVTFINSLDTIKMKLLFRTLYLHGNLTANYRVKKLEMDKL